MTTKNSTHRSPHAIRLLTLLAGLASTVALTVPTQVPVLGVQTSAACTSGSSSCGG